MYLTHLSDTQQFTASQVKIIDIATYVDAALNYRYVLTSY